MWLQVRSAREVPLRTASFEGNRAVHPILFVYSVALLKGAFPLCLKKQQELPTNGNLRMGLGCHNLKENMEADSNLWSGGQKNGRGRDGYGARPTLYTLLVFCTSAQPQKDPRTVPLNGTIFPTDSLRPNQTETQPKDTKSTVSCTRA